MFHKQANDSEFNTGNKDPVLGNFWAKLSKASYSRDLVKAEKKRLMETNSRLQALLREYCVQNMIQQNLTMLGLGPGNVSDKGKTSKARVVAQEASVIPQIRTPVLKMKAKQANLKGVRE